MIPDTEAETESKRRECPRVLPSAFSAPAGEGGLRIDKSADTC